MNAASMKSARMLKLLAVLKDGKPHSTRAIARKTENYAVGTSISELRQNGARIVCRREYIGGKHIFFYTMLEGPKNA